MARKRRTKSVDKQPSKPSPSRPTRGPKWLLLGLPIVVVAAVGWWLWSRPGEPASNVILLVLDTVRRDAVGCYADRPELTPRIDDVASEAVRFSQAVSTSGWTVPAIASLFTGAWPTVHGSLGRGLMITGFRPELPVASELFKEAGYGTVAFANSAFVSPALGVDRGFDVFDHNYGVNWDARRADATITAAISELRRRRGESTFYFIHLFDPHLEYDPPGHYATKYTAGRNEPAPPLSLEAALELQTGVDGKDPPTADDRQYVRGVYDGEVSFMDEQIGRFIDELKSLDLYESATIVITSDHGEEFWEHGGFEHGHSLYDELVMIPLIIKFPDDVGMTLRVVESQVRLLDVMPTVFDVLDIDLPETFVGESLMPFVRGESNEDLPAYCESTLYGDSQIALRGSRYKYIVVLDNEAGYPGALYDWRNDPGETMDLEEMSPRVAEALRTDVMEWHRRNKALAARMSELQPINMHPERIERLRALGYIR
jgi:arylsulfatase A-like enzyme